MSYRFIDDETGLGNLVAELEGEPLYGLDTELHRERTYYPQLALVQLSGPHGVSLIDPLAILIRPLGRLLEGPGTCIIHAASQDPEILQRETGTLPSRLLDPQIAAGFLGMGNASLASLCRELLRVTLDESVQLADWLHRPPRPRELDCAASDVLHLLTLHAVLRERLEARDRFAWAEEECERMRSKDRSMRPPETARWKLEGKGKLSGQARGVAQCVAAWRERRAASLDRLPRMVLPDMVLLGIAGRPPFHAAQLRRVRGMEGRFLADGAEAELLAAIEEGLRLPPRATRSRRATAATSGRTGRCPSPWRGSPRFRRTRRSTSPEDGPHDRPFRGPTPSRRNAPSAKSAGAWRTKEPRPAQPPPRACHALANSRDTPRRPWIELGSKPPATAETPSSSPTQMPRLDRPSAFEAPGRSRASAIEWFISEP